MEIKFTLTGLEDCFTDPPKRILYGDFNTLNFIYETGFNPDCFTIFPDSTFVYFILRYLKRYSFKKIVSTDLLYSILETAVHKKLKLFFFGDSQIVLEKLRKELTAKFKTIEIAGTYQGYSFNSQEVIEEIKLKKPNVLFIGLGAGKQEEWLYNYYNVLNIPYIFTTGGWFRLLAGINKRAPKWMININIEWLYKLITQFPKVWKRYLIMAPTFLYRVLSGKILLKINCENSFLQ